MSYTFIYYLRASEHGGKKKLFHHLNRQVKLMQNLTKKKNTAKVYKKKKNYVLYF